MLQVFWQDSRYAIRTLLKSPGFASVAILSLALGIGANTAIFSLIDAVMLKSLPVSRPQELLQVRMVGTNVIFSNPIWEQIRDRQDVFSGIFAYGRWRFNLAAGGEARYADGSLVSGEYFETLGVRSALGRTLTPDDDRRGCAGTAVLSHAFWRQEYGGRADVLGKTILLNNHPIEIVGVAEPRFTGIDVGSKVDVLVPLCSETIIHGETSVLDRRDAPWLRVVGRSKPGVPPSQAAAHLNALAPEIFATTLPQMWRAEDQERYLKRTFETEPAATGLSYLRTQYREALVVLMAVVALVLLSACANVANLLLACSTARRREIAVRVALGAGRGRLLRQGLTESLLMAGIGAAVGILIAQWGADMLVAHLDVHLDLEPNVRVLAFTAGLGTFTGLLLGIVSTWRATRVPPQAAMKANSSGAIEGSRFGLGKALVAAQVAVSLLVVVSAGLMLSTFWRLVSLDPGFDQERVLITSVDIRNGDYSAERRLIVFREILEKLRAIPGVSSAAASNIPPIGLARWTEELVIEGYNATSRDDATVHFNQVSDRYFETLGIGIVSGRDFNRHDTPGSPKVAIINKTMADKFFRATNPIGKYYRTKTTSGLSDPVEVVGVVTDSKYGALRDKIPPTAYTAWSQDPIPFPLTNFELRAGAGSPTALIGAVKAAIAEVNPHISLEVTTLDAQVDQTLKRERLLAALSALFAALALVLATVGLYGVMSYDVARRRHDIGIRIALGAEPARVVRMVLGEVGLLIGIGLVGGLGLTLATTRFVASLLYDLTPTDPVTLVLATGLLAAVAFAAGYFPARQASRQDPMTALRED